MVRWVAAAAHLLVAHFDALRRRVAHAFYLAIVVLHFNFFEALVSDLTQDVLVRRVVRTASYCLRGSLGGLRAHFT